MRAARLLWLCGVLLCAQGCVKHYHFEHNAPGDTDVKEAPARKTKKLEKPRDPGENMLAFQFGGFAGGGAAAFGRPSGLRGAYGVGPEFSFVYGSMKRSHSEDDFVIFPRPAYGLNLGWTMLTYAGTGLGPLYGELQYSDEVFAFAAGWAYDKNDNLNGPQVTTSLGPVYMRASYLGTNGVDLQIGLVIKAGLLWVWSR
jgi:hypothetical protein